MRTSFSLKAGVLIVVGSLSLLAPLRAQAPGDGEKGKTPLQPSAEAECEPRATIAVARDRAQLLHRVYIATLEMMHDRYFHEERSIVPARALEDVFSDVAQQSQIKARWISVNTKAMSVHHEPKSEFEKQAAKEISGGKQQVERIEQGLYQRAAAIPLASGCVACHTGHFSAPPKSPRFAALVISIPVAEAPSK